MRALSSNTRARRHTREAIAILLVAMLAIPMLVLSVPAPVFAEATDQSHFTIEWSVENTPTQVKLSKIENLAAGLSDQAAQALIRDHCGTDQACADAPTIARIVVSKQDTETGAALPGASFSLTPATLNRDETGAVIMDADGRPTYTESTDASAVKHLTTNDSGVAVFDGLRFNSTDELSFVIREEASPAGYSLDPVLAEGRLVTITRDNPSVTVVARNAPYKRIAIEKVGANCDTSQMECGLAGAEFALYDVDPTTPGSVTPGAAGEAVAFVDVTVADGDPKSTIRVSDPTPVELPMSGGRGIVPIVLAAVACFGAAAVYMSPSVTRRRVKA